MIALEKYLKQGARGGQVALLQQMLAALHYLEQGGIDGAFGPATERAVRDFQDNAGLSPDGVVGPNTWKWLGHETAAIAEMPPEAHDFDTAGEGDDDPSTAFVDGWWTGARRMPIHPGRQGGAITMRTATWHSTDMLPDSIEALVAGWARSAGSGAGAHFLIDRRSVEDGGLGAIQFTPITRNGNHAGGGNGYGQYRLKSGALVHPNRWAAGIEVHNAGLLKRDAQGRWCHRDTGHVFPDAEVHVGASGRGWHRYTAFQFRAAADLHHDLSQVMAPIPAGTTLVPNGDYKKNGVPWAAGRDGRVLTLQHQLHVTLDPINKTDGGEQLLDFLLARV